MYSVIFRNTKRRLPAKSKEEAVAFAEREKELCLTVGCRFLGADIWWEGHKPEKLFEVNP